MESLLPAIRNTNITFTGAFIVKLEIYVCFRTKDLDNLQFNAGEIKDKQEMVKRRQNEKWML